MELSRVIDLNMNLSAHFAGFAGTRSVGPMTPPGPQHAVEQYNMDLSQAAMLQKLHAHSAYDVTQDVVSLDEVLCLGRPEWSICCYYVVIDYDSITSSPFPHLLVPIFHREKCGWTKKQCTAITHTSNQPNSSN